LLDEEKEEKEKKAELEHEVKIHKQKSEDLKKSFKKAEDDINKRIDK